MSPHHFCTMSQQLQIDYPNFRMNVLKVISKSGVGEFRRSKLNELELNRSNFILSDK